MMGDDLVVPVVAVVVVVVKSTRGPQLLRPAHSCTYASIID
jgi:hypothetical protein